MRAQAPAQGAGRVLRGVHGQLSWWRGHDGGPFFRLSGSFAFLAFASLSGLGSSYGGCLSLLLLLLHWSPFSLFVRRVAGWMGALSPLGGSGAARSWLPVVVVRSFVRCQALLQSSCSCGCRRRPSC